jgi:hypothetical protein
VVKKPPQRVEVDWLDSVTLYDGGWIPREEITPLIVDGTMHQRSVGYLLHRGPDAFVIAQHMQMDDDTDESRQRFGGVVIIPASAVIDWKELAG